MLEVRANGSVWTAFGLRPGDHLCWIYDDEEAFVPAALCYIADGLMLGERVLCVADPPLRAALARMDPTHLQIAGTRGPAVTALTVGQAYGWPTPNTPEQQLAFYAEAAANAASDGYTGLRVLAEVTAVAADPIRQPTQLCWEQLADAVLADGAGLSALCAYRRDALPPSAVDDLCCVHPLLHSQQPQGFRMFFDSPGQLAFAGALTDSSVGQLRRLLATVPLLTTDLTLDLSLIDGVDPAAAYVLEEWSAACSAGGIAKVSVRSQGRD